MVVVDLEGDLRVPEDPEHLGDDVVPPRVGVRAREVHRLHVEVAAGGADVEHRRLLALRDAVAHVAALSDGEEPGRDRVAHPARAEVVRDPGVALVVGEDVHVVVP